MSPEAHHCSRTGERSTVILQDYTTEKTSVEGFNQALSPSFNMKPLKKQKQQTKNIISKEWWGGHLA